MFSEVRKRVKKVGQAPGTPHYTGDSQGKSPLITVTTFTAQECHETTGNTLAECMPAKPTTGITWVNVEGLHDLHIIDQLAKQFQLHPLTIEDILNVEQRPKIDEFENYIFITLKALLWQEKTASFSVKQISIVIGNNFVLSFQELDTTLFDAIRMRLKNTSQQRLREQGSDYLAYRLMDAIVDDYFIILETVSDQIEKVEELIISTPTPQNTRTIYRLKRQMLILRKTIWPMREVIGHLMHAEENIITKFTRLYLRDVYDHIVQAMDTLETFRDILASMLDMYLSSLTNRMNEIMKTLTIISTIFIPITAIASIYGTNFEYIPGLHWHYGYPLMLAVMILITLLMLIFFRQKKWI